MEIQNITIVELASGLLALEPFDGYQLLDKKSHSRFSHAEVRPDDLPYWTAVVATT